MKKTSVEMLLLLSAVYGKKGISELNKDLRGLTSDQLELLLKRLEEVKAKTFGDVAEVITSQLEEKRQTSSTAGELAYLILIRYKLKPPDAAQKLSDHLSKGGYAVSMKGAATKANFGKWLQALCEEIPRDTLMNAALSLRPSP